MESPPILVIDLETTSSKPLRAGIVEIGACFLDGVHEFEMRCRPGDHCHVENEALLVSGCDWLDDTSLPAESVAVTQLFEWIRRTFGPVPVIAARDECGKL